MEEYILEGPKFFKAIEELLVRTERDPNYKRSLVNVYMSEFEGEDNKYYASIGKVKGKIQIVITAVAHSTLALQILPLELSNENGQIFCTVLVPNLTLLRELEPHLYDKQFWSDFKVQIPREDYFNILTLWQNKAA